jgi:hypothetical protein
MSQVSRGPVVIDTGVFGAQLTRRTWPLGELYRPFVEGRAALVSFVIRVPQGSLALTI